MPVCTFSVFVFFVIVSHAHFKVGVADVTDDRVFLNLNLKVCEKISRFPVYDSWILKIHFFLNNAFSDVCLFINNILKSDSLMFHRRALHENYFHAINKIKPTDAIQNHEIGLLNTHSFLH